LTLVANSAGASKARGVPFAGGPILRRLRLGDPQREFATSVDIPVCRTSGLGVAGVGGPKGRRPEESREVMRPLSDGLWGLSKLIQARTKILAPFGDAV
jgi:hypothetical protein